MTDTALTTISGNDYNLTRFMPRDLTELVKFSQYASQSGVFGAISANQALIVMLQGAEYGINPLQALREIPLVNGKPRPSAALVAGLIQRSPDLQEWVITSDKTHAVVTARRRGRSEVTVTVKLEDVPSSLTSKQVWKDNAEDMLVARAIHRMARRHFADLLTGIQDPDEIDETRVIDIAKVERVTGMTGAYEIEHAIKDNPAVQCAGVLYLHAARTGGAYLECEACGMTMPPPQEVRDAVRGTPSHLTIAGASEAVLEPGERVPTAEEQAEWDAAHEGVGEKVNEAPIDDPEAHAAFAEAAGIDAPESAVQSDSESATLEPADPRTFEEKWRDTAREKLIDYLEMNRANPSNEERMVVLKALRAVGWDSDVCSGNIFVGSCEDDALNRLLGAFKITALP